MSITNEQILDAIAEMSVMQVVELIEAMEEKFGVSAAAAVVAGGAVAEAAEEQTEFDVILERSWRKQSCSNQSSTWRNWSGPERSESSC